MLDLYNKVSRKCSEIITKNYSTSFSSGIRAFPKYLRQPIYSVYGFVRLADEIVDTFHDQPRKILLNEFREDTQKAIERKISLNPVLNAFQEVVHRYGIAQEHIDAFLDSMEMDLYFDRYRDDLYEKYIFGSAEVVGLMCLKVFLDGDEKQYDILQPYAQSLGSAFQKVNFLRDMKSDFADRGRVYFPGLSYDNFSREDKLAIESDIALDFEKGYEGILRLPKEVRFGVYLAYTYYTNLFAKLKKSTVAQVKQERIRVNDGKKMLLLCSSLVKNRLNMI